MPPATDDARSELARLSASEQQQIMQRLVDSSADGILAFDTECRYTVWNPPMERIAGMPAERVLGRRAFEVFPFLLETGEDHYFHEALAGRHAVSVARRFTVPESGREGYFEGYYSPIRDQDGRVTGGLGIIRDVTERQRAEQERLRVARIEASRVEAEAQLRRFEFLADVGERLSSSLDYDETMRDVARLVIPILGDMCIVDAVEDGHPRSVATAHAVQAKAALVEELRRRYPPSRDSPQPVGAVLRSGELQLLADVTPEVISAHARDAAHADLVRRIGIRSHLAVPLVARGTIIGIISVGITESDRHYGEADVALAMDLARRAALAVDNARLYRRAQEEIAERRRVEMELRVSEARARAILDQSPLATQVFGIDGRHVRVNRAWEQLWGTTWEQVPPGYTLFEDKQLEATGILPFIRRAFAGEKVEIPATPYDTEKTAPNLSTNQPTVRWVRAYVYPIKNPDETVREIVVVHEDVTARLQGEEKLRESEERLRVLAHAGETLGASLDISTTLKSLAEVVVPRLADWCTVELIDETGEHLERAAVFHPDEHQKAASMEIFRRYPPRRTDPAGPWQIVETGEAAWGDIEPGDLESVAHDDEHLELLRKVAISSYLCVPLVASGRPFGVLSLAHAESKRSYRAEDVTLATDLARRAAFAVENARLYQRVREDDRRKDEFLATLAHELRNPLAPIRSGLEVLRLAPPGASTTETKAIMERQVSHLVRLIDDLLDLSRVTQGKIELRPEPLSIQAVVRTAMEASSPAIESAGLHLVVRMPGEPLMVEGDPTRMAQVVVNLLTNATRFTPRGGGIEVEARREANDVILCVKDTGIGIEPHMLSRIFDMFVQVERAGIGRSGGLGIGLTLVRRLVELHGGRVWAESGGEKQGSAFFVRLPLVEPVLPDHGSVAPAPLRTPRRVLVVDDNVDAAKILSMLLEMDGHEVHNAASGPAALQLLQDFRPEIAFLDIGMPVMDGYELARRIRKLPEHHGLVLVALTGWGHEDDRRRARAAGFHHHLTKPAEMSQVNAILKRLDDDGPAQ